MAKVPNGVETLPKISIARVHESYRQTDDTRTGDDIANVKRKHDFTRSRSLIKLK